MHYRILFLETGECPLVLNEQWSNGWNDWVETKPNSFTSIEEIRNVQRYRDKCTIGIVDLHGRNVDPPKVSEIATYFLDKKSEEARNGKEYESIGVELKDAMDEGFRNLVAGSIIATIQGRMQDSVLNLWDSADFTEATQKSDHLVPDWNPREPEKFQKYNPTI